MGADGGWGWRIVVPGSSVGYLHVQAAGCARVFALPCLRLPRLRCPRLLGCLDVGPRRVGGTSREVFGAPPDNFLPCRDCIRQSHLSSAPNRPFIPSADSFAIISCYHPPHPRRQVRSIVALILVKQAPDKKRSRERVDLLSHEKYDKQDERFDSSWRD